MRLIRSAPRHGCALTQNKMRKIKYSSHLVLLASLVATPSALAQSAPQDPPVDPQGEKDEPAPDSESPEEGEPKKEEVTESDEVMESDDSASDEASDATTEDQTEEGAASQEEVQAGEDGAPEGAEAVAAPEEVEGTEDSAADTEVAAIEAPAGIDASLWEPGEEPYRPPPAKKGAIWGRIVEPATGEGAIEAQVKVRGQNAEAYTDIDGYFRLELLPGTYTLEVYYALHEPATFSNIEVTEAKLSRVDSTLRAQEGAVDTVIIEEEAETQTVEGLALARQRSAAQGDAVGREEIAKTTDSNAADAAQRVVGATIVGGRFVYVRGLGERYSNSLLSGYPLPSPEPDRAAVPLDVFPTAVIDSLTIVKTFTPDMPGDFAGGSVQIETRSVPKEPMLKLMVAGGVNTQSTFQQRLDHPSSATDWLGIDSGMRKLPSSVPTDYPATTGAVRPDGSNVTEGDLTRPGRAMNSAMSPKMDGTPINHGFGIVGGNTWDIGSTKLGVLASANYSHKYESYEDAIQRDFTASTDDPRGYDERLDYKYDRGVEKIRWGTFGKISFLPSSDHKISLTGLHSQLADDTTTQYHGTNSEAVGEYQASQLDWVERGLTFGLLSGRHTLRGLRDAEFDWDLSIAQAYRDEPDRRDTAYRYSNRIAAPDEPNGRVEGWEYVNKTASGRHFWAHQTENSNGGKVDWMQPILQGDNKLSAKAGGLVNIKRREFSVRRFQMQPNGDGEILDYACEGATYNLNCPDQLFTDENIGTILRLNEGTETTDAYHANLNVYAAYLMGDFDLHERLRITTGARVEWTEQTIDPYNQFGGDSNTPGADLNSTDVLPSLSTVYSATEKLKIRAAYGRTLARPQVRELAPFAFADYYGGNVVSGNPDLQLTSIQNFDLRFELWPSLTEVIAVTGFYKSLKDPIEELQIPTGGVDQITFKNADHADVIGGEFEVRKGLGFLNSHLGPFQVISNLTLTWSQTEVQEAEGNEIITNPKRSLLNQSPWVFNGALDYQSDKGTGARITYNVNGPTLIRVGTFGLPDAYARSFNSLDLSASQKFLEKWSVKATIENILNDKIQESQGKKLDDFDGDGSYDNIALEYTKGTTISLGLGYEI